MVVKLTRVVQTSMACPAQWDAWDADGNYYYLRFRHGCGEMRQYTDQDWVDAPLKEDVDETQPGWIIHSNTKFIRTVATFEMEDEFGVDTIEQFASAADIELASDIYKTSFGDHVRDELIKDGMMMFLEGTDG
jgi:hypothetical protein